MRKLWGMLAHLHGNILNIEQLSNSMGISATTVRRYLDYLEGAFLIHRLQPYYVNLGKRLVKAPKVYLVDSGILHFLLDLESENDLQYHPQLGASWEGYVIAQIKQAAPNRIDTYFYRTHAGAECDLVLVRGNTVRACIEIKLSKTPVPSKGFYQSTEDLKCKNNFLIVPNACDYKNNNGILIVDIKTFIIKYLSKI
jgi:predicted AAA+ superfamily ATPase